MIGHQKRDGDAGADEEQQAVRPSIGTASSGRIALCLPDDAVIETAQQLHDWQGAP